MRDVSESGVLQNEANISFGFNGELGFATPCHAAATGENWREDAKSRSIPRQRSQSAIMPRARFLTFSAMRAVKRLLVERSP